MAKYMKVPEQPDVLEAQVDDHGRVDQRAKGEADRLAGERGLGSQL